MSSCPKPHHIRREFCRTRKAYREGREPKAVKVYTVAQESKYLIVQGIPALGLHKDLLNEFMAYGSIEEYCLLDDYPTEEFTEVLWIKFAKIQSARFAKRKMDNANYCGGELHVFYAPEYESVDETRAKLQDRRRAVSWRLRLLAGGNDNITKDSTAVETEQISQETSGQPVAAVTALSHVVPQQAPSSDGVGKLTSDDYLNALALPLPPPPLPLPTLPPQPFALHQRYLSLPQQPTSHYPPLAVVPSPFVRPVFPPFPIRIHSERSESQSLSYVRPPHFPPPPPRPPAQSLHVAQSQQSIMCSTKPEDGMGEDYLGSRVDRKPTAGRSGERQPTANNPMIIKNYVHTGSVPRFVPRQLVKRSSAVNDAAVQPEQATADPVNEELKRTALTLGPVPLGPALPPDEERRRQTFLSSESGDSSIDQTVAKIREKVQEFTSSAPAAKKLKQS